MIGNPAELFLVVGVWLAVLSLEGGNRCDTSSYFFYGIKQ